MSLPKETSSGVIAPRPLRYKLTIYFSFEKVQDIKTKTGLKKLAKSKILVFDEVLVFLKLLLNLYLIEQHPVSTK